MIEGAILISTLTGKGKNPGLTSKKKKKESDNFRQPILNYEDEFH
jgi:hypothetical protein